VPRRTLFINAGFAASRSVGPTLTGRRGRPNAPPRDGSLVRLRSQRSASVNERVHHLKAGVTYVYLGAIPNMPGHCVVADAETGQLFTGYHIENFEEIPEDEV
jgi:hypothetical protein